MATDRLEVAPEVFLEAMAWPAPAPASETTPVPASTGTPATEPAAPALTRTPRRRRTTVLLTTTGLVVVAAGVLVGHSLTPGPAGPAASVAAFSLPQGAPDVLADDDVAQLVVQPGSTRLLLRTASGAYYAARSASGELCLVRVPDGALPSEVCVPDRVGADATIGDDHGGRVRLVADGAPQPSTVDGWQPAGPNVWVRG
ncbi:MAG TPA: hypothetical protein VGC04_05220 [Cellulomonas sp.]